MENQLQSLELPSLQRSGISQGFHLHGQNETEISASRHAQRTGQLQTSPIVVDYHSMSDEEETAASPSGSSFQSATQIVNIPTLLRVSGDEQTYQEHATPQRVTDPVMSRYNQWITLLGPGLSAAERLRVIELASQEVLGTRENHQLPAFGFSGPVQRPEFSIPVVKLTHATFPTFDDRQEGIDSYLKTFEIICEDYDVPRAEWPKILASKLTGKASDVYRELSYTQRMDYEEVKRILFENYAISPETYRQAFRALTKEPTDTHWVFASRLCRTFDQWVKTGGVQTLEGLRQLCLMEQFLEQCAPEVRVWVWDRSPLSLEEAARLADKFLESRMHLPQRQSALSGPVNVTCAPRLETKNPYPLAASQSTNRVPPKELCHRIKTCYRCGSSSHLQAKCPQPSRESVSHSPQTVAFINPEMVEAPRQPTQTLHHHTQVCTSYDMPHTKPIGEYIVMGVQQADQEKYHHQTIPVTVNSKPVNGFLDSDSSLRPNWHRHSFQKTSQPKESLPQNCTVYIGNLGKNGTRAELERAFGCYGSLSRVWIARKPPGFAFVQFENPHDAAAAVQALNRKILCGNCVKVEFAIRRRYETNALMRPFSSATKNFNIDLKPVKHMNVPHTSRISSVSGPLPTEGSPINTPFTGGEKCDGSVGNCPEMQLISL